MLGGKKIKMICSVKDPMKKIEIQAADLENL